MFFINLRFSSYQNISQKPVGFRPGVDYGIGRAFAQHFTDRGQEVGANDRVMFGLNHQGSVFLRDQLDRTTENFQIVDIGGISTDGAGEGALLRAGFLVRGIEERGDFGVMGEHPLVKMPCQGFGVLVEDRGG